MRVNKLSALCIIFSLLSIFCKNNGNLDSNLNETVNSETIDVKDNMNMSESIIKTFVLPVETEKHDNEESKIHITSVQIIGEAEIHKDNKKSNHKNDELEKATFQVTVVDLTNDLKTIEKENDQDVKMEDKASKEAQEKIESVGNVETVDKGGDNKRNKIHQIDSEETLLASHDTNDELNKSNGNELSHNNNQNSHNKERSTQETRSDILNNNTEIKTKNEKKKKEEIKNHSLLSKKINEKEQKVFFNELLDPTKTDNVENDHNSSIFALSPVLVHKETTNEDGYVEKLQVDEIIRKEDNDIENDDRNNNNQTNIQDDKHRKNGKKDDEDKKHKMDKRDLETKSEEKKKDKKLHTKSENFKDAKKEIYSKKESKTLEVSEDKGAKREIKEKKINNKNKDSDLMNERSEVKKERKERKEKSVEEKKRELVSKKDDLKGQEKKDNKKLEKKKPRELNEEHIQETKEEEIKNEETVDPQVENEYIKELRETTEDQNDNKNDDEVSNDMLHNANEMFLLNNESDISIANYWSSKLSFLAALILFSVSTVILTKWALLIPNNVRILHYLSLSQFIIIFISYFINLYYTDSKMTSFNSSNFYWNVRFITWLILCPISLIILSIFSKSSKKFLVRSISAVEFTVTFCYCAVNASKTLPKIFTYFFTILAIGCLVYTAQLLANTFRNKSLAISSDVSDRFAAATTIILSSWILIAVIILLSTIGYNILPFGIEVITVFIIESIWLCISTASLLNDTDIVRNALGDRSLLYYQPV